MGCETLSGHTLRTGWTDSQMLIWVNTKKVAESLVNLVTTDLFHLIEAANLEEV